MTAAVPHPAGPTAAASRRGAVVAGLMLTLALAAMDTTIVATAVPQIVGSVGGFAIFGWLFSIYLLTQTVTIPVYGKLADVYGRKPVLLVGVLVFLTGSALCSSAWSMVALIVFRGLQGLGAGSIQATVQTIAGDLYSLRERGRVQAKLASVWAMAAVAGPTLGGVFADYVSWRWIFLINLPVGALALLLIVRFLQEARGERRRHRVDYLGSVLVLLSCAVLVFALLQGGVAWPWWSAHSIGCFALAAVLAAATVAVERRAAEPVVPGWVWRERVLAGSNLGYVALGLLVIGPSTFLPTYGQTVLGLGAVGAGLVLGSMTLSWPVASALSNRLYLRIGFRDTALVGVGLTIAGTGLFVLLPPGPPVWPVVASTVVLGAGLGLIATPLLVGVQSTVEYGRRGVATGSLMFTRFLGQSIGAAVFAAVVNGTLTARLRDAPPALAGHLPGSVDGVAPAVAGGRAPEAVVLYLRSAMDTAVHHLYVALVVVAVLAVGALFVAPRRFPVLEPQPTPAAAEQPGAA